jgi:hypothetical protein
MIINKASKYLKETLSKRKENKSRKRKKKTKSTLMNFKSSLWKEMNQIKIGDLENMRNFALI